MRARVAAGAVSPASDRRAELTALPRGEHQLVQAGGSGTDEMMPTLLKIRDYYTDVQSSVIVRFSTCLLPSVFPLRFGSPSAFRLLDQRAVSDGQAACGVVRVIG